VEGTHGQLRARLTDRLRGDNADSLTHVDRRTTRKVAAVAGAAHAAVRVSQVSTERIFTSWMPLPRSSPHLLRRSSSAGRMITSPVAG
jgi:hypothetical protein